MQIPLSFGNLLTGSKESIEDEQGLSIVLELQLSLSLKIFSNAPAEPGVQRRVRMGIAKLESFVMIFDRISILLLHTS